MEGLDEHASRFVAALVVGGDAAEDDALSSVTTGFGLLNEPDAGIDYWRMLNYYEDAYATIRRVLGKDVAVYVGDMFNPKNFNWSVPVSENSTRARRQRKGGAGGCMATAASTA